MTYRGEKPVVLPEVPRKRAHPKPSARWCKGKVGREHTPGEPVALNWARLPGRCGTRWYYVAGQPRRAYWSCCHHVTCTACGKTLRYSLGSDCCPDWLARGRIHDPPPTPRSRS